MYEYVPDTLAPNPPILLVVHFCSGNAHGVFQQAQAGGLVALADQHGFIMVLPQTSQNCWDVATMASLTHDGGGDTGAMVHQVEYAIATHVVIAFARRARKSLNLDRVVDAGTATTESRVQRSTAPPLVRLGSPSESAPEF
jgi:poly(3-hydroxybutyrate) depolymerase